MKVVGPLAVALALAMAGCTLFKDGDKDDNDDDEDDPLTAISEDCPDPPEDCYAAIAAYLELDEDNAGPVNASAAVFAEINGTQTSGSMIVKVTGPTVGEGGTFTVTPDAMANVTWNTAFETRTYEATGEVWYLVFPFTSSMERKDIVPTFTLDVDDATGDFSATGRAGNPYAPGALDSAN